MFISPYEEREKMTLIFFEEKKKGMWMVQGNCYKLFVSSIPEIK